MKRSLSASNGKGSSNVDHSAVINSPSPLHTSTLSSSLPKNNNPVYESALYEVSNVSLSVHSPIKKTPSATSLFLANESKTEDIKRNTDIAPVPAMYWYHVDMLGSEPPKLRAHASAVYEGKMYVYGGTSKTACSDTLCILDLDTFYWSVPKVYGSLPPPCRAHCFVTDSKTGEIYLVGGGDGQTYYNHVYKLDVASLTWTCLETRNEKPTERRAQVATLWNNKLCLFGGGDGTSALNDVYQLDLKTLEWNEMVTTGEKPVNRGYHTGTLVKDKWVIFGGSDGKECFGDVHVLDFTSQKWHLMPVDNQFSRLSHTATCIGSFLLVIGGHDGNKYCNDLRLLNLVNMSWETKKVHGKAPSPRGYHTTVFYDSRLFVFGGYDGLDFSNQVHILELSSYAYLPQIINFSIDTFE
ncbi:hypothetical protein G6F56_002172 [Rhizopus delemar]|nr:hypothetical protein G6F56_002172 [Rhizopus delemar]